jgi:hypothetical protein
MTQLRHWPVSKCRGGAELFKNNGTNFPLVGGIYNTRGGSCRAWDFEDDKRGAAQALWRGFEIDPELTIRRKKWWNVPAWAP